MEDTDQEKVVGILDSSGFEFEVIKHKKVYTNDEMARELKTSTGATVKSIVLKDQSGDMYHVMIPGNRQLDVINFSKQTRLGRLELLSKQDFYEVTGFRPGALPPFGHKTKMKSYISSLLINRDHVFIISDTLFTSIRIAPRDLASVCNGEIFHGCLK